VYRFFTRIAYRDGMNVRDRARLLADSGQYEDARAVIFALFKLGYARAPKAFGFLARMRLSHACRVSCRRARQSRQ
jgi:hypothetical protein